MNSRRCCYESAVRDVRRSPTALQHLLRAAQWAVPGALLVVMPKCPVCLVAYVALFTGLGLSLSAAAHLRMLVLLLCVTMLVVLSAKWVWAMASPPRTL